jgi:hypothetical protein
MHVLSLLIIGMVFLMSLAISKAIDCIPVNFPQRIEDGVRQDIALLTGTLRRVGKFEGSYNGGNEARIGNLYEKSASADKLAVKDKFVFTFWTYFDSEEDLNAEYKFEPPKGFFNEVTEMQKWQRKEVASSGFRVIEVVLNAAPDDYVGPCPIKIKFSARISVVGGGGIVSYKFLRSDEASGPIKTVRFARPGSKDVSTTWLIGSPTSRFQGWQSIKIFDPNEMESDKAHFKIDCE